MNTCIVSVCLLLLLTCAHGTVAAAGATSPVFSAALACNAPPSSATAQADMSGRLWGWSDGASCAFKDATGHPLFYRGYTPSSAGSLETVTACQDPSSSLSTAVKDSAGNLWGWEEDKLCRLEQPDNLPAPEATAAPDTFSSASTPNSNSSSGWLTPASAASPDAIIQPAPAASPLPPAAQPAPACQPAPINASLELSETELDRLADAVAQQLSATLFNSSRGANVLGELNSTGYGWSLLHQEPSVNVTATNQSDAQPGRSPVPEVPAVNVPAVSTNDILKDTFGIAPSTVNGSGLDSAQAASDNAGGPSQQDSRRLMLAQPAPGGMTLPSPIGHGKATIPLVYVDPSAPVEQTNGGFKVAEQGEAAVATVYRTPVAAKSIKGTPWVFGPAGITSPSGRFLGAPTRLSALPYDTRQTFSIASETVGAYVDKALTNAQQLSGFQPLGHRNS